MEQREEIFRIETIQSLMATRRHTMEMSQDQLCSQKKPSTLVAVIEKWKAEITQEVECRQSTPPFPTEEVESLQDRDSIKSDHNCQKGQSTISKQDIKTTATSTPKYRKMWALDQISSILEDQLVELNNLLQLNLIPMGLLSFQILSTMDQELMILIMSDIWRRMQMLQWAGKRGRASCVTHRRCQDQRNTMVTGKVLGRIAHVLTREMPRNFRLEMMVKKPFLVIQRQALLTTTLQYNQLVTKQA